MNQRRQIARYTNGNVAAARRVHAATRHLGAPPPSDDTKIDLSEVLDALYQGKWIILITCLLLTSVMVVYTKTTDPIYEASSVVFINTGSNLTSGVVGASEPRSITNELGLLQESADLTMRVAERIRETVKGSANPVQFPIVGGSAGDSIDVAQIAMQLVQQVRFEPLGTQDMIAITAGSTTPQEAALIANVYAEEYVQFNKESSRANIAAKRAFLEEQVAERRKELAAIEGRWEDFAQQRKVVTLGDDGERLVSEFVGIKSQRDNVSLQLEQETHALQLLQRELARIEPALEADLEASSQIENLQAKINALNQQIATLEVQAGQYYAINPNARGNESSIQALSDIATQINHYKKERDDLQQQLVARTSSMATGATGTGQLNRILELKNKIFEKDLLVRELQHQLAALDARIGSYSGDLQSIPRQIIETMQLDQQREIANQWYMTFVQELQKTIIAEEAEQGYVKIVRSAVVPLVPVSPDLRQNLLLGILLGLGIGVALAFGRKAVSKRIQQPHELEANGYNLIGVIPAMDKVLATRFKGKEEIVVNGKALSTRLVTLHDPWSPISESYRLVRTNIRGVDTLSSKEVVLVTSPEMSDGKTLTAVNLAIASAQLGRRTLLIDADMRRPSMHRMLGIDLSPGLIDLISGELHSLQPIQTVVKDLWAVPAGKATLPPAEFIGSEVMVEFLEHVRAMYDVVIIDSPPVLAVTDSVLLAPLCDTTILVVSAHRTDMRALEVTKKMLAAVGVPIAGTIFNRFDIDQAGGYKYGFGYGYTKYSYGEMAV